MTRSGGWKGGATANPHGSPQPCHDLPSPQEILSNYLSRFLSVLGSLRWSAIITSMQHKSSR